MGKDGSGKGFGGFSLRVLQSSRRKGSFTRKKKEFEDAGQASGVPPSLTADPIVHYPEEEAGSARPAHPVMAASVDHHNFPGSESPVKQAAAKMYIQPPPAAAKTSDEEDASPGGVSADPPTGTAAGSNGASRVTFGAQLASASPAPARVSFSLESLLKCVQCTDKSASPPPPLPPAATIEKAMSRTSMRPSTYVVPEASSSASVIVVPGGFELAATEAIEEAAAAPEGAMGLAAALAEWWRRSSAACLQLGSKPRIRASLSWTMSDGKLVVSTRLSMQ